MKNGFDLPVLGSNARASGAGTNHNASDPQPYDPIDHDPIAVFSVQNLSGNQLTNLVPSVDNAATDSVNKTLIFTGNFGTLIGRGSLDGVDVAVKTWTPERITTVLPKSSGKALMLSSTGLISNKVSVTAVSSVSLSPKNAGPFWNANRHGIQFRQPFNPRGCDTVDARDAYGELHRFNLERWRV